MALRNKPVQQDVVTTQVFVPKVVDTTSCQYHEAPFGTHCFEYQSAETEDWFFGICNSRAKAAGMDGYIHPTSLDRTIIKSYR